MDELEQRECGFKLCQCKFKVMPNDGQKYCSTICMMRDNKVIGKDKMQFKKWKKENQDKIRVVK